LGPCKYQQHLSHSAKDRYIEESLILWTTWYIDHTHTHTHTHTLRCWLLPEVLGSEPDFAVSITFTNETSTFFFILFFQKKLHTEKFILFRAIAAVRKLNERAKYTLWSPSFDVNIIRRLHYELRDTSAVSVTQKLRRDKKKHTKFRNTTS